jgi:hypothetical protein
METNYGVSVDRIKNRYAGRNVNSHVIDRQVPESFRALHRGCREQPLETLSTAIVDLTAQEHGTTNPGFPLTVDPYEVFSASRRIHFSPVPSQVLTLLSCTRTISRTDLKGHLDLVRHWSRRLTGFLLGSGDLDMIAPHDEATSCPSLKREGGGQEDREKQHLDHL